MDRFCRSTPSCHAGTSGSAGRKRKSSSSRYSINRLDVCRYGTRLRFRTPPTSSVGQQTRGCRPDEQVQGFVQGRPEPRRGSQPVLQELAGSRLVQRLGEQVVKVVHDHAPVTELRNERVVLGAGPVSPHDIVEEQVLDVVRCEPGQAPDQVGERSPGGNCRLRSRHGTSWLCRSLWLGSGGREGLEPARSSASAARGRPECRGAAAPPDIRNGPQTTYQVSPVLRE